MNRRTFIAAVVGALAAPIAFWRHGSTATVVPLDPAKVMQRVSISAARRIANRVYVHGYVEPVSLEGAAEALRVARACLGMTKPGNVVEVVVTESQCPASGMVVWAAEWIEVNHLHRA